MTTSVTKKQATKKQGPEAPKPTLCETWDQVGAALDEVELNNAKIARTDDGYWRLKKYILEM
jgi:hypothetical protein